MVQPEGHKKIFFAILNWGIGHATRSIPIIYQLLAKKCEVIIASDGRALEVLRQEFPQLTSYELAALDMQYHKNFFWGLSLKLPTIINWYTKDIKKLKSILTNESFDIIISDSRPAIASKKNKNIFIINQPNPIVPWIFKRGVRYFLNKLFNKYDEIWIPDLPGNDSLSGTLAQLKGFDIKIKYIGFTSRIKRNEHIAVVKERVCAIISGPEPNRTELENFLRKELVDENHFIVGGVPGGEPNTSKTYASYLSAEKLAEEIEKSEYIISRGGYSSLMDLASFNKKIILIPTTGQTEQEYLAARLAQKNEAVIWDIHSESWQTIKSKLPDIFSFYRKNDNTLLSKSIDDLILLS